MRAHLVAGRLEGTARDLATGSRLLAAGYVFVAPTYRSRDVNLQTADSLEDALAVVEHLRTLSFVDGESIVVGGCSGGGDLALQVASRERVRGCRRGTGKRIDDRCLQQ